MASPLIFTVAARAADETNFSHSQLMLRFSHAKQLYLLCKSIATDTQFFREKSKAKTNVILSHSSGLKDSI